jgi:protein-tyrosine kinase
MMNKAKPSLLERAAEVYDFASGLPMRPDVELPPARTPRPVQAAPVAAAPRVQRVQVAPEPAPVAPAPQVIVAPRPAPKADLRAPVRHRQIALDTDILARNGLLVGDAAQGTLAEEYRLVKRRLLAAIDRQEEQGDPAARVVLIASGQPGEGKTFTAANLALSLAAEQDRQVLLIDGDTAKPDLARRFGIGIDAGFVDALTDRNVDVEGLVLDTDIERFAFLPGGRHERNLPELLASARTDDVFARLIQADSRRIIIVDSAPALAASAAGALASHAGQALIVVRADQTAEADIKETTELLSACRHLSLMLNGTAFQVGGRRFGKYEEYR